MKGEIMELEVEITREYDGKVEHLGEKERIETKSSFLSQKQEDTDAFEREFKTKMHAHVVHFLQGGTDGILRGFGCTPGIKSTTYYDDGCKAIFRYCLKDGVCEEEFVLNVSIVKE